MTDLATSNSNTNSQTHIAVGVEKTDINSADLTETYFGGAFSTLIRLKNSAKLLPRIRELRKREDVLTVCILSFLSLEAAINGLYHEVFILERQTVNEHAPRRSVRHVKQSWKRLSIKDKYLLLPPLVSDMRFNEDAPPFNLFVEFIRFRNRLVHAKSQTVRTKTRITEVDETSYGGKVIEENFEAPDREASFPLTKFSTVLSKLEQSDAEKAFEIMHRMRIKLWSTKLHPPPFYIMDRQSEPFILGDSITSEIKQLFNPHFGNFESFETRE